MVNEEKTTSLSEEWEAVRMSTGCSQEILDELKKNV